jgi:phage tail-like protein
MAIINNRGTLETDPLRNFRFLVTFNPQDSTNKTIDALKSVKFGFTSVSGLSIATDSIPYREGGYNTTVHQIPGQSTFTPITLQRGVMLGANADRHWKWMRNIFSTMNAGGTLRTTAQNFRCDLDIQVLAHPTPAAGSEDGTEVAAKDETGKDIKVNTASTDRVGMRFKVYNAWPTAIAYSDLNAGDNALLVEQMTLVHEGFDISIASALSADATSIA